MNRNVRRGSVGRANKVGWSTWAFTLGWVIPLIIALITTFLPTAGWGESVWWFFALVILGLLIGYGFNKDSMGLLYVTLILALLMTFAPVADVPVIGPLMNSFFAAFLAFLSPAAFVLIFKKIYHYLK